MILCVVRGCDMVCRVACLFTCVCCVCRFVCLCLFTCLCIVRCVCLSGAVFVCVFIVCVFCCCCVCLRLCVRLSFACMFGSLFVIVCSDSGLPC